MSTLLETDVELASSVLQGWGGMSNTAGAGGRREGHYSSSSSAAKPRLAGPAAAVEEDALSLRGLFDGDTEPPVLPSSIQRSFLSVICSKCLRPFRGAPAVIIGGRSARFLIGSVGPYQRRIFQDL